MSKKIHLFLIRYLIPLLIIVLPFVLPTFRFTFDVGTILTVIAILFTILTGFFIAAATSNYLRLQSLITNLNAGMISMFDLARLISPKSKDTIVNAIDDYMISTLDFSLLDFATKSEDEFQKVVAEIDKIIPDNNVGEALMQNLHGVKTSLYNNHQEMAVVTKTVIKFTHWMILIILSLLIGLLTLTFRDGQIISTLMVAVLLSAIYQTLKLLFEVDNNIFLAKKLAFQSPQQVFRMIGRLPYYPEYAIKKEKVSIPEKIYRVGIYLNFPKSYAKKITIIKAK